MTRVDQFESVFRSALRDSFHYKDISLKTALLATDMDGESSRVLLGQVQEFLKDAPGLAEPEWQIIGKEDFTSTEELLSIIEQRQPQIICTYRNLHSNAWRFPHSLGEHLDVLLQKTPTPVLVLPHPKAGYKAEHAMSGTARVMAMTSHLTDDHALINHAIAFTAPRGTLSLAHIEDEPDFNRFMSAIAKIPAIDTQEAEIHIRKQLLKEPGDYIQSCRQGLERAGFQLQIKEIVTFGNRLSEYKRLVEDGKTELLVMHAKDQEQLAMHGLAYPLAIELRQIPILML